MLLYCFLVRQPRPQGLNVIWLIFGSTRVSEFKYVIMWYIALNFSCQEIITTIPNLFNDTWTKIIPCLQVAINFITWNYIQIIYFHTFKYKSHKEQTEECGNIFLSGSVDVFTT